MQQTHHHLSENDPPEPLSERLWKSLIEGNYFILIILGLALLIRILGVKYGLLEQTIPAEKQIIDPVLQTLKNGSTALEMNGISPLAKWFNLAVVVVTYVLGNLLGWIYPASPISDPANLPVYLLAGRLVNICLAVISIYAVYRLAKAIYGQTAGLIAMILMTFLPMHVEYSHFINASIPAVLFGLSALYMMVQAQKEQQPNYLIFAGIFSGLAFATQVWMGVVVIGFIYLFLLCLLDEAHRPLRGKLWIGWVSFFATYLAVTPSPLFDLPQFLDGVGRDASYLVTISGLGVDWASRISNVFMNQVGILLSIAILLGLVALFQRVNQPALLLFAVIVAYTLFVFHYADNLPGLLLPVITIMLVLAGGLLQDLIARVAIRKKDKPLRISTAILSVFLVGELLLRSGIVAYSFTQKSTSAMAREYIQTFIPGFYKIALEEGAPVLPGYETLSETVIGYNHPYQWYIDNQYAVAVLVEDQAVEYSAPKYARVQLFRNSVQEHGTLVQEYKPSIFRQGPQIRIYSLLPIVFTGQDLFSENFINSASGWKVIGGKWEIETGRYQGSGDRLPQNLISEPVDADKDGIPDGWWASNSLLVSFTSRVISLHANRSNQALYSPIIPLTAGDQNSTKGYTLSLEFSGEIISPFFFIEYVLLDSNGKQIGNQQVLEQTGAGSFDWQQKTYTLKTNDLPAGTQAMQILFLAWSENAAPELTVKVRNISLLPVQAPNMVIFVNEDALHWDKYIERGDIAFKSANGQAGFSFYQQDESNTYMLELDIDTKTARLVVVQDGVRWVLAEVPFDVGPGIYNAAIDLSTDKIIVSINGQELFQVHDDSFSSGTIGLWVAPGAQASFGNIHLKYGGQ